MGQTIATPPPSASDDLHALFAREHRRLERELTRVVNTSPENVQDAMAFAWCALVRRRGSVEPGTARAWLLAVARHEALKLDRRARRTLPIENQDGEPLEFEDPRQDDRAWDELLDAAAAVGRARLTDRQARMLSLSVGGFSYEEIALETAASPRVVERQLLRARRKLAAARGSHAA